MNNRRAATWLLPVVYYAGLLGYFLFGRPSLFVALFSLWSELVIMLLIYFGLSIASKNMDRVNKAMGIVGSAVPLLILEFCIASGVSVWLNEFAPNEGGDAPKLLTPFHAFSTPLIIACGALLLIYGVLTRDLFRARSPIHVVESGLLFQAALLSVLGIVALVLCSFTGVVGTSIVLNGVAVVRIILQPMIRKKFEQPVPGIN
jgi:hypothetical protein